jgi:hypothetical protein
VGATGVQPGDLLDAHVETDDVEPCGHGTYRDGEPDVALTDDDHAVGDVPHWTPCDDRPSVVRPAHRVNEANCSVNCLQLPLVTDCRTMFHSSGANADIGDAARLPGEDEG